MGVLVFCLHQKNGRHGRGLCSSQFDINAFAFATCEKCLGVLGFFFSTVGAFTWKNYSLEEEEKKKGVMLVFTREVIEKVTSDNQLVT